MILFQDEDMVESREKRSKPSDAGTDSTEDEIGILCLSNDDESIEDADDEVCQPIKKARTRAKRARQPKVIN